MTSIILALGRSLRSALRPLHRGDQPVVCGGMEEFITSATGPNDLPWCHDCDAKTRGECCGGYPWCSPADRPSAPNAGAERSIRGKTK